ncbi:MAG: class I SAM-dependent methyltransferase [Methanosarcinaceae archaeon]|nr:class I SAM-dependent methyltransferase [Methanosarcinaceae archaeon]
MNQENTARSEGEVLDRQQPHWENIFSSTESRFGIEPSYPAKMAAGLFKKEGVKKILELGGGQGRDSCFFAGQGFEVTVIDYTENGTRTIKNNAEALGLSESVKVLRHDVRGGGGRKREGLPFGTGSFDACYSHMLYCMALTTEELETLCTEVRRVLKPGGINLYTARNTGDAHYKTGIHRGEDMYEIKGGFIVHFFSREKVEKLAREFQSFELEEFEEGELPRKLYMVSMRK